jgi:hypothetical protein
MWDARRTTGGGLDEMIEGEEVYQCSTAPNPAEVGRGHGIGTGTRGGRAPDTGKKWHVGLPGRKGEMDQAQINNVIS